MNLAQIVDPQWVLAGCPASCAKWRAQHLGVLHITTVVNGIQTQRQAPSVPTRADAEAHLQEVRRAQQAASALHASEAAHQPASGQRSAGLTGRGLARSILLVLAGSHQRMSFSAIGRALGDPADRHSISAMLTYLYARKQVDRIGEYREYRYSITPKGRERIG